MSVQRERWLLMSAVHELVGRGYLRSREARVSLVYIARNIVFLNISSCSLSARRIVPLEVIERRKRTVELLASTSPSRSNNVIHESTMSCLSYSECTKNDIQNQFTASVTQYVRSLTFGIEAFYT
jgi:hypothetical protein